jgi:hypothetical protein
MEIPLASAKMTTSAVMNDFMAGLGVWPEWLWNAVIVGAPAITNVKAFTHFFIFRVLYVDLSQRALTGTE